MAQALGVAYAELQLKTSAFKSGLAAASSSMVNWHSKMKKLAVIAISVAGVAGAVKGLKSVIGAAADFEQAMAGVKAVTQPTAEEFAALEAKAKELGKTTKFTMTDIASGMEYLGRAGFSATEIIKSMSGVASLAAASSMDLGNAADITSKILRGMGLDAGQAGHVADVLAKAAASANVDVEMLGESFKYIAPIAKAAGFSLEETAAAISKLGDVGVQGSMAGTSLRYAFSELLSTSDDFVKKLNDMGISIDEITDKEGNLLSFGQILDAFAKHGISTAQVIALMGKRAGPALASLLDQTPGLKELTLALKDSEGAAAKMAKVRLQTFNGQLEVLRGSWMLLKVTIGEYILPILTKLLQDHIIPLVNGLIDWASKSDTLKNIMQTLFNALRKGIAFSLTAIRQLIKAMGEMVNTISEGWSWIAEKISGNEALQKAFSSVAGWAKDFADRLVEGFGRIADFIEQHKGPVVAAITAIGAAFTAWQVGAWIASLNPLTVAIAGVSAALAALIAYWPELTQAWESAKRALTQNETLMAAWKAIRDAWETIWEGLKTSFSEVANAAKELWAALKEAFAPIGDLFKSSGEAAIDWKAVLQGVMDGLTAAVKIALDSLAAQVKLVMDVIKTMFKVIADLLRGDWKQAWIDFKDGVIGAFNILKDFLVRVWGEIKAVLDATGLTTKILAAWTALQTSTEKIWGTIRDTITGAWDSITTAITNSLTKAKALGIDIVNSIKQGLVDTWHNVTDWFEEKLQKLIDTITGWMPGWLKKWLGIGESAGQKVQEGLQSKTNDVEKASGDLAQAITHPLEMAKEDIKQIADGMVDSITTSLAYSKKDVEKTSYDIGAGIGDGLASGILDSKPLVESSVSGLNQAAQTQFKTDWDMHSPSRLTYEYGAGIVQGLADGVQERQGEAVYAIRSLGDAIREELNSFLSDIEYKVKNTLSTTLKDWLTGKATLAEAVSRGLKEIGSTIVESGIDRAVNWVVDQFWRMVTGAQAATRAASGIASGISQTISATTTGVAGGVAAGGSAAAGGAVTGGTAGGTAVSGVTAGTALWNLAGIGTVAAIANPNSAVNKFAQGTVKPWLDKNVAPALNTALKPVGEALSTVVKPVAETIGGMVKGVAGIIGGIGHVLGFAQGGIVYKPALSLIGERGPEVVAPLDKIGQPATINIYLGNERIAKAVMKELRSANLLDTGYGLEPVGV